MTDLEIMDELTNRLNALAKAKVARVNWINDSSSSDCKKLVDIVYEYQCQQEAFTNFLDCNWRVLNKYGVMCNIDRMR